MNDLIVIDPKELAIFAQEGGKFLFKPQAEEYIIKLLEVQKMATEKLEEVKSTIEKMGLELNPNFKGVKGEKVSCIYRKYGSKYEYDWKKKEECMPFLKEKKYYSVDSEKVDKYLEDVKELPEGITESQREEKLTITYNEE